jgi:gamma-glutamylcyclotransferase (GGCT)/AIG2-like uncharacterized protein YtfP
VSDTILHAVNNLEGYNPLSASNTFYDRIQLDTPYGKAYTFIYQGSLTPSRKIIKEGDWSSYIEERSKLDFKFKSKAE